MHRSYLEEGTASGPLRSRAEKGRQKETGVSRKDLKTRKEWRSLRGAESLKPDSYGMKEERRHQTLRSPHVAGARRLARSRLGDGARWRKLKTTPEASVRPAERQSPADSANRGRWRKPVFRRRREIQAAAPADRRETDLRVAGGGTGRGVPARKVAPHGVGA